MVKYDGQEKKQKYQRREASSYLPLTILNLNQ